MTRRALFVLSLPLLSGCYGYYPVERPVPVAHQRVLVALTDGGTYALTSQIGPSAVSVEGLLLSDSAAAYTLSALAVRKLSGLEDTWRGEHVFVPQAMVASITERRFSSGRTTLFSVAMAAALIGIRQALAGAGIGGQGPGHGSGGAQ